MAGAARNGTVGSTSLRVPRLPPQPWLRPADLRRRARPIREAFATQSATMGPSPRRWPCTGLGSRLARVPSTAPGDSWRCAGSPSTWLPTTRGTRCRLSECSGARPSSSAPHLFIGGDVALLNASMTIKPVDALPPHTFRAFFGLLASTGLRCGEALGLQRQHVDLTQGRLTIVKGKPGRARVVPIHASVVGERPPTPTAVTARSRAEGRARPSSSPDAPRRSSTSASPLRFGSYAASSVGAPAPCRACTTCDTRLR